MSVAVPFPTLPPTSVYETSEYKDLMNHLITEYREKPKPKDWASTFQWDMAVVHTAFLNLIMRTYAYAEYAVENNDLPDYLGFCDVAFAHLHLHHHFEEDFFFPYVEKCIPDHSNRLTINVKEHSLFEKQVIATWLYVRRCRSNLSPAPPKTPVCSPSEDILEMDISQFGLHPENGFSVKEFRDHLDNWVLPVMRHLNAEIETLDSEFIGKMGEKNVEETNKAVEKHLQVNDPTWFLVSFVGSLPMPVVKATMQLPLFVRRFLVPLVWSGKYQGYWKYLEYPENLTFWGSA